MLSPNNILQNFESVLNDENDKKNQSYYYEDELLYYRIKYKIK